MAPSVRDEPTRRPDMLTAWHAGERTYALQAAAADQLRSEQYLDAMHANARLYRHDQWGMDGDTPVGRDLAKDARDDSAMHVSACDGQVRSVERNGHPAADPITPFLEIGRFSPAMIATHTKNMQAEHDIHCAELHRIRRLELNVVDCLLGPTANRIARARDDILAELMRQDKRLPPPIPDWLVQARVRLWRWYELVLHTRTERLGGAMTHGANPNGLPSEPRIDTHKTDAAHLAGSDDMLKAIDNAAPLLDVSCLGSSWRSILRIEDSEYAGLLCCCHQQPQHCVITKIGRLIGRTFMQRNKRNRLQVPGHRSFLLGLLLSSKPNVHFIHNGL